MNKNKIRSKKLYLFFGILFLLLFLIIYLLFFTNIIGYSTKVIFENNINEHNFNYNIVSPQSNYYESTDYLDLSVDIQGESLDNIECSWILQNVNGSQIEISNLCNDLYNLNELKNYANRGQNYKLYLQINKINNGNISAEYFSDPIDLIIIPSNPEQGFFLYDEPSGIVEKPFYIYYYYPISNEAYNGKKFISLYQDETLDLKGNDNENNNSLISNLYLNTDCIIYEDKIEENIIISNSLNGNKKGYTKNSFKINCQRKGTKKFVAKIINQSSLPLNNSNNIELIDFKYNIYTEKQYNLSLGVNLIPPEIQDNELEEYKNQDSESALYFSETNEDFVLPIEISTGESVYVSPIFEYISTNEDTLEDIGLEYNNLQNTNCNLELIEEHSGEIRYSDNMPCNIRKKLIFNNISSGDYSLKAITNYNNKDYSVIRKIKIKNLPITINEMVPNNFMTYPSDIVFTTNINNPEALPITVKLKLYARSPKKPIQATTTGGNYQNNYEFSDEQNKNSIYFSEGNSEAEIIKDCENFILNLNTNNEEILKLKEAYYLELDNFKKTEICGDIRNKYNEINGKISEELGETLNKTNLDEKPLDNIVQEEADEKGVVGDDIAPTDVEQQKEITELESGLDEKPLDNIVQEEADEKGVFDDIISTEVEHRIKITELESGIEGEIISNDYYLYGQYDLICNKRHTNCYSPNVRLKDVGRYFGVFVVTVKDTGEKIKKEIRFGIKSRPIDTEIEYVSFNEFFAPGIQNTESIHTVRGILKYERNGNEWSDLGQFCDWEFSKSIDYFDGQYTNKCVLNFTANDFESYNIDTSITDYTYGIEQEQFTPGQKKINIDPKLRIIFNNDVYLSKDSITDNYTSPYYGYHQYGRDVNFTAAISYYNAAGNFNDENLSTCNWEYRPIKLAIDQTIDPKGGEQNMEEGISIHNDEPWIALNTNECNNVTLGSNLPIGMYQLKLNGHINSFELNKTVIFRIRECGYLDLQCPYGGVCNKDGSCTYTKISGDSIDLAKNNFNYNEIGYFNTYLSAPYFSGIGHNCNYFESNDKFKGIGVLPQSSWPAAKNNSEMVCSYIVRNGYGAEYESDNFTNRGAKIFSNFNDQNISNIISEDISSGANPFGLQTETITSGFKPVIDIQYNDKNYSAGYIFAGKSFTTFDEDFVSFFIDYNNCDYNGQYWYYGNQGHTFACKNSNLDAVGIYTDLNYDLNLTKKTYNAELKKEVNEYILVKLYLYNNEIYALYANTRFKDILLAYITFKLPLDLQLLDANLHSFDQFVGPRTILQPISGTNMPTSNISITFNQGDLSSYLNSITNYDGANIYDLEGNFDQYFINASELEQFHNTNPFNSTHQFSTTNYQSQLGNLDLGYFQKSEKELEPYIGKNSIISVDLVTKPAQLVMDNQENLSGNAIAKIYQLIYYLERNNENYDVYGKLINDPDYKIRNFAINTCDINSTNITEIDNSTDTGNIYNCEIIPFDNILSDLNRSYKDKIIDINYTDINDAILYFRENIDQNFLIDINNFSDQNLIDVNNSIIKLGIRHSIDYPSIAINNDKTKLAIVGIRNIFVESINIDENSDDYNKYTGDYSLVNSSIFVLTLDLINNNWTYEQNINLTENNLLPVTNRGNTLLFDSEDTLHYSFIKKYYNKYDIDGASVQYSDLTLTSVPAELVYNINKSSYLIRTLFPQPGEGNTDRDIICDPRDQNDSNYFGCYTAITYESSIPSIDDSGNGDIELAGNFSSYSQQSINLENKWMAQIWMSYPIAELDDTTHSYEGEYVTAGGSFNQRYVRISLSKDNGIHWTPPIDLIGQSINNIQPVVLFESDPYESIAFPTISKDIVDIGGGVGRFIVTYYKGNLHSNQIGGNAQNNANLKIVAFDFNFDSIIYDNNKDNFINYLMTNNSGQFINPKVDNIEFKNYRKPIIMIRESPDINSTIPDYNFVYSDSCANLNQNIELNNLGKLNYSCIKGISINSPRAMSYDMGTVDLFYHFPNAIPKSKIPATINNGCFKEGTKISTPSGLINIEEIKSGQVIYSYDSKENKIIKSTVNQLIVHDGKSTNPWVILKLSNGLELTVTVNHSFFDPKENKFKKLYEFREGENLLYYDLLNNKFIELEITELKILKNTITKFYNLDISEPNNYFANGVVVHNLNKQGYACTAAGYWWGVSCDSSGGVSSYFSLSEGEWAKRHFAEGMAEFLADFSFGEGEYGYTQEDYLSDMDWYGYPAGVYNYITNNYEMPHNPWENFNPNFELISQDAIDLEIEQFYLYIEQLMEQEGINQIDPDLIWAQIREDVRGALLDTYGAPIYGEDGKLLGYSGWIPPTETDESVAQSANLEEIYNYDYKVDNPPPAFDLTREKEFVLLNVTRAIRNKIGEHFEDLLLEHNMSDEELLAMSLFLTRKDYEELIQEVMDPYDIYSDDEIFNMLQDELWGIIDQHLEINSKVDFWMFENMADTLAGESYGFNVVLGNISGGTFTPGNGHNYDHLAIQISNDCGEIIGNLIFRYEVISPGRSYVYVLSGTNLQGDDLYYKSPESVELEIFDDTYDREIRAYINAIYQYGFLSREVPGRVNLFNTRSPLIFKYNSHIYDNYKSWMAAFNRDWWDP